MRRTTAAVVGFLVASLIPALLFSVLSPVSGGTDIIAMLRLLPGFYVFSLLATVVLAVPVFLLFLRFRLVRWWSVLGAGFGIGALIGFIVRSPNPVQIRDVLVMSLTGVAAALGFWLVWNQAKAKPQLNSDESG